MATNNNNSNSNSNDPNAYDNEYYQQQQQQQLQAAAEYQNEADDIVQVVYQSNQHGSLVGVESSLLSSNTVVPYQHTNTADNTTSNEVTEGGPVVGQQLRSTSSTLPSVAEESSNNSGAGAANDSYYSNQAGSQFLPFVEEVAGASSGFASKIDHRAGSKQADDNSFNVDNKNSGAAVATNYEPHKQQLASSAGSSNLVYQGEQHYPDAIYSTVNKNQNKNSSATIQYSTSPTPEQYNTDPQQQYNNNSTANPVSLDESIDSTTTTSFYTANCVYSNQHNPTAGDGLQTTDSADTSNGTLQNKHSPIKELLEEEEDEQQQVVNGYSEKKNENLIELFSSNNNEKNNFDELQQTNDYINTNLINSGTNDAEDDNDDDDEKENNDDNDFHKLLTRSKGGAAESGSFRHNFRKKLGVSVSTNENDLIAHRQKLLEVQQQQEATTKQLDQQQQQHIIEGEGEDEQVKSLPKFKRTHSVSFNVGSNRSGRHSVDIRNLPSYLTVKRASIVDVAKSAMSSLMHSLGASGPGGPGGGAGSGSVGSRRDSSPEDAFDEPIFEEPIAPTLSLGQRVALVKNSGAEFGTVGWIGQLPDVDDDWIVGVIFDNMIGNCDGEHNGVRYFYSRENYAMFVPLSSLTKTDNYIGRPETGTMLSRMSVSLKPGQLISIHRSSIRLQHCFLNAPHQRVGHDVRAVSNRLHCQCHNCGPCAHLTKQGRVPAAPLFGAHHAPNKKNSLAHAAVEILAHHHHHYHEEEHHEEDYQFGDNAAHACNFVRYSCCQQAGSDGHDFSADCQMVRPELLDNLIHAPRAPHRRSRPRRSNKAINRSSLAKPQLQQLQLQQNPDAPMNNQLTNMSYNNAVAEDGATLGQTNLLSNLTTNDYNQATIKSASSIEKSELAESSSYSSCSSRSSSPDSGRQSAAAAAAMYGLSNSNFNQMSGYQYNTYNQTTNNNAYSNMDTQMSIIDQQRFIFRKESSTIRSKQSMNTSDDDYYYYNQQSGFGSSIRRCLACLIGRKNRNNNNNKQRRPKKRKLSARNRLIEYRRRQSTFVPSTLAKPHEDFASHGIILPSNPIAQYGNAGVADSNSDYSSYSRSSNSSSRSESPDNNMNHYSQNNPPQPEQTLIAETYQQPQHNNNNSNRQTMTLEHGMPQGFNEQQLKSCSDKQLGNNCCNGPTTDLNYDDYTFSDGYSSSIKKEDSYRCETDLGYYDSMASNSNDTLKQIVDQAINEEEPLNNEIMESHYQNANIELISPLLSLLEEGSNQGDVLEISSPTVSTAEYEEDRESDERAADISEKIHSLNLNDDDHHREDRC